MFIIVSICGVKKGNDLDVIGYRRLEKVWCFFKMGFFVVEEEG